MRVRGSSAMARGRDGGAVGRARTGLHDADGREVQLDAEPYLVAAAQRRWETAAVGGCGPAAVAGERRERGRRLGERPIDRGPAAGRKKP